MAPTLRSMAEKVENNQEQGIKRARADDTESISDTKHLKEDKAPDSKLVDKALEASLSSSKSCSKRPRPTADYEAEQPLLKKSNNDDSIDVITPKSKLKNDELDASLSSSQPGIITKLKIKKTEINEEDGDIEDKDNECEDLSGDDDTHETEEKDDSTEGEPATDKDVRKVLVNSIVSCDNDNNIPQEKTVIRRQTKDISKIPSKQVISKRELTDDRKLQKKRLNKMLAIFDDQKEICGSSNDR